MSLRGIYRMLAVLSVALLATIGLLVYAFTRLSTEGAETRALAHAIQQERVRSIGAQCHGQNAINASTIRRLKQGQRHTLRHLPAEARALHLPLHALHALTVSSDRSSVALINALAPRRDCARFVVRSTTRQGND